MFKFLLTLFVVNTHLISAQEITTPYIECDSYYQLYTNCILKNHDFIAEPFSIQRDSELQKVESSFTFEFRFDCDHKKLPIFWHSGEVLKPITKSLEWKTIKLTGIEKLEIEQNEDSKLLTKGQTYLNHCSIQIRDITVSPSQKTIELWKDDYLNLISQISEASYSLNMINDVIMFKSAFNFLSEINLLFLEELSSKERTTHYNRHKSVALLLNKITTLEPGFLNKEELKTIAIYIDTIETLPDDQTWTNEDGSSKSLSDFISDDDHLVMRELQQRVASDQDYHRQRLYLFRKINSLNETTKTLKNLIETWEKN